MNKKILPKQIYLSFLYFIIRKVPLFKILGQANAEDWINADKHLFNYNNTLITLSSGALLLSFTATQLKITNLNGNFLLLSWIFFYITIVMSVIVMLLNFFAKLANSIWERLGEKQMKTTKPAMDDPIISTFYNSVIWMFVFSLIEFFSFLTAVFFLLLTASKII